MSFLSVLGKIFHAASNPVVQKAASQLPGQAGSLFSTVLGFMGMLEAAFPQDGAGTQKNDIATEGSIAVHPGVDQAAVSAEITKIAAALNALRDSEAALNALQAAAGPKPPTP